MGMRYPNALRSAIGLLPVPIGIDGLGRQLVLRLLDPLFHRPHDHRWAYLRGLSMQLDLARPNERLLQYACVNLLATYARSALGSLIRRCIRDPHDVFVDIGANLGIYSLLARRAGGRAILFEPEPRHAEFLQRNEQTFGKVHPYALSDVSGSATLHVGVDAKLGVSSLVEPDQGADIYDASVVVPVLRFDDVATATAIDPARVRLIKVDVEGNEARTIAGMTRFLGSGFTGAIWCEVRGPSSTRGSNSHREVTSRLRAAGFSPYLMKDGRPQPFDPTRGRLRRVFDLLFCRPEDAILRARA
jgi:FkbM family methyltransferase